MSIEPNWSDKLWPYSAEQLDKIRACLQIDQQRCIGLIINAARVFAALKTGPDKKPQPADEIAVVKALALDLYAALSRMSQEADAHLAAKWEEANSEIQGERLTRETLLGLLHRFIHENQSGFDGAPPSPSRGPIVQKNEAWLVRQFEQAFIAGHDGKFPTRGWPEFLNLCWDPMVPIKLIDKLSERSLQHKLTESRQYFGVTHTQ